MSHYIYDRTRSRIAVRNPKQYAAENAAACGYTLDRDDLEIKQQIEAAHQRLLEIARSDRRIHWQEAVPELRRLQARPPDNQRQHSQQSGQRRHNIQLSLFGAWESEAAR